MKKKLLLLLSLVLGGCVQNGIWYKANSTEEEFNQVRYLCLKESQQVRHYNNVSVNQTHVLSPYYQSYSSREMVTNTTLFNACMRAHGFLWKILEPKK
jgi:hypothetical protein